MSMASISCYTSVLGIQYSFGIGSDKINFKKVYLLRESHSLYMCLPVSEFRAQTVVHSSVQSGALGLWGSLPGTSASASGFNPGHPEYVLCIGGSLAQVESCKDLKQLQKLKPVLLSLWLEQLTSMRSAGLLYLGIHCWSMEFIFV